MNMVELIERLEKATWPDSTLDGNIFRAVAVGGSWWSFDGVWHLQDTNDTIAWAPPPPYTSSIDSALSLVPEGRQWDLLTRGNSFRADVWKPSMLRDTPPKQVRHTSPAIALCIAAPKARAAPSEPEGTKEDASS